MTDRQAVRLQQIDLFVSGQGSYHTYRIPSLLATQQGSLLAFCEARKDSRADSGDIDLALRRSVDGGETWGEMRIIADVGCDVIGNPCPVQDRFTGTIWLPLCWNRAEGDQAKIVRGKAPRTVWLMGSEDDGATWSEPFEITQQVKRPEWTWYATGPGHGIQLQSGRLLIPCDYAVAAPDPEHRYFGSHVIYSDDHGATWQIGGTIQGQVNECQAVELEDGSVYVNMRSYHGRNRRAYAWSRDGGDSWSEVRLDEALIEPVCQAGLLRLPGDRVLFANPNCARRERMTVRLSDDRCRTWSASRVLWAGPSAYSDLAATLDGRIYCLYERGERHAYERITLARFTLEWLA